MAARRPSVQTLAVLDHLARRGDEWAHGYELCQRLALKAGTVYPILIRLAERDLVETAWEEDRRSGRPPRHLYRLSAGGWALVAELKQQAKDAAAKEPTGPPIGWAGS